MNNLPIPRAIIFDWDNTLVDTWPTIQEALNKTFEHMGHEPWDMETVKQRVARSMRDSFPDIFGENWQDAATYYQSSFRAIHLERLTALPGAADILSYLSTKPVYLAIASNKKGPNLRIEAAHIGWDKYFGNIVGADDTPKDKPAVEPVHAALKDSGIVPGQDVWFIGDSPIDMECAHRSGCTPVFYGELPQKPLAYPFSKHVENHAQLQELLDSLLK